MNELPTYDESNIASHSIILSGPTSVAQTAAPSYDNSTLTFLVHPFSYGCERITTINNQQRLYFLESPTNVPPYNTSWVFILSLRDKVPPSSSPSPSSVNRSPVIRITKSNYYSVINLEACNSTWKRKLRRLNIKDIGEVFECIGLEGITYWWKRKTGTNDYMCVLKGEKKIVGHLVRKTLRSTQSVRGEIYIHADYASDSELLLACALSLEALGRMVTSGCKIM